MNRRILGLIGLILLVAAAFFAGLLMRGDSGVPGEDHGAQTAGRWTCSMHPQIILPGSGQCPICFMDLIPLEMDDADEGPRSLVISEAAAALADIRTRPVERKFVAAEIRLLGRVDVDQTRAGTISAWVPGRLDTLFVDYTGATLRIGQPMASIYSPQLYAAQTELLNARRAVDRIAADATAPRSTAAATLNAARERLRHWGLSNAQIESIEEQETAREHLHLQSPAGGVVLQMMAEEGAYVQVGAPIYRIADLSRVWIELAAYESDLPWLRVGQAVDFSVKALPGQSFAGRVLFIEPVLDSRSRTAVVRLEASNTDGLLKPGMFASAVVKAELTAGGEPRVGRGGNPPLVIPASAPLLTGTRAVVYIRLPGRKKPTFEGRDVRLGPRAGDYYLVAEGLSEGEQIVFQGAFKLDSALQIQAKPSMMSPEGDRPAIAYDHAATGTAQVVAVAAPAAFRSELDSLLDAYLMLQTTMADDDPEGSVKAAQVLDRTLAGIDGGELDAQTLEAWIGDAARLALALKPVLEARDFAAGRIAFEPLSDTLWMTLQRFGLNPGDTARLFHCPMAGADGANWIQRDATTANPYYGDAMLRCGSQVDTLSSAGGRR